MIYEEILFPRTHGTDGANGAEGKSIMLRPRGLWRIDEVYRVETVGNVVYRDWVVWMDKCYILTAGYSVSGLSWRPDWNPHRWEIVPLENMIAADIALIRRLTAENALINSLVTAPSGKHWSLNDDGGQTLKFYGANGRLAFEVDLDGAGEPFMRILGRGGATVFYPGRAPEYISMQRTWEAVKIFCRFAEKPVSDTTYIARDLPEVHTYKYSSNDPAEAALNEASFKTQRAADDNFIPNGWYYESARPTTYIATEPVLNITARQYLNGKPMARTAPALIKPIWEPRIPDFPEFG